MTSNNYRFRSINFPTLSNTNQILFAGQSIGGTTNIPGGSTDLDLISVNINISQPGRIFAFWSASVELDKDGLSAVPVFLTYTLLQDANLFPGSERRISTKGAGVENMVMDTLGITGILPAGNYSIILRILEASAADNSAITILPEGSLTVFILT